MDKLKVLHIHTDKKFVGAYLNFEGDNFSNKSIIISENNTLELPNIQIFSKFDLDEIVKLCNQFDVVVLYNLDVVKSKIALKISTDIKIIWRFFGTELYSLKYLSYISKEGFLKGHTFKQKVKSKLKEYRFLQSFNSLINRKENPYRLFFKAIERINFILVISKEEYGYLKSVWPTIPAFIKAPPVSYSKEVEAINYEEKNAQNKPRIIVGNSRSKYNNHLDILNIIEKYSTKHNYNFKLFFSYGKEDIYSQRITKEVSNKPYFELITDFLSKEDFNSTYNGSSALVINSFRQLAGANIILALEKGLKVYLNDKNIHKNWLINEGFKIFSIAEFEEDLKNNKLFYDEETAKHNNQNLKTFINRYTKEDFQINVKNLM
ncbi:hypothetical protein SAMN05216474_1421 [Lishizhenia tianjinensis]|uniref:4-alpha-L-fucosyltransferase glycosyl transferase group 56 n=1 Tax=Lishizhenia tianjinensis TaxID=477690 RepID=A0A1I6ZJZ1_9FLAO|nr:hypothetical protein [Lishizhenia tianjinensis]SFT62961.1 hypothetical protein SAMN05216474_1421 [Lishizhenia tianjinensis]